MKRKTQNKTVRPGAELPFVLKFLKYRKGVTSATTTGVWNDVDRDDKDA